MVRGGYIWELQRIDTVGRGEEDGELEEHGGAH
jgi:hypothetical protein